MSKPIGNISLSLPSLWLWGGMQESQLLPKGRRAADWVSVLGGLFALASSACQSADIQQQGYDSSQFQFIDSPNQRKLSPDTYFGHEYLYLNSRRGLGQNKTRPKHLTGLAMSGGGIRSAAFQLGILTGLNASDGMHEKWLSKIDYIASVSGGSWANGEYWSTPLSDDKFLSCLDGYAKTAMPTEGCPSPYGALRNRQEVSPLPIDNNHELKKRKSLWEKDIIDAHLGSCNIDFDAEPRKDYNPTNTLACRDASSHRPYPIFASTHSSREERASVNNHVFESTPDYQGTISEAPEYRGFFIKSGSRKFLWENRDWKRWIPGGENDHPGEVLSLMLAHSSGVIGSEKPFLLQYNFHAHYKGEKDRGKPIKGLREIYKLTDGGKSDNLGVIPLIERNVDTIIVSQMGKEGQDFEDIKLAALQAKKLFGCTFRADWPRNTTNVVEPTPYQCPNGNGAQQIGKLILVRPTIQNVGDFLNYLRVNNPALSARLDEIDANEKPADRFPETPTFRRIYDESLIRAYFLLGKYLAETSVSPVLNSLDIGSTH